MAQNLVVNGVTFLCPQQGDQNWAGANGADGWMAAVTTGMLQKAGGTFALTADVNFGASFGLVAPYFKSGSSNIAASGAMRLANADSIAFRNAGNSADQLLTPGADGILNYAGAALLTAAATATLTNKTMSGSSNTFSNIAYASLVLTGAVVNADIAASAAIALSKLATIGAGTILGNNGGGSAVPAALTAAQALAVISPLTTKGDILAFSTLSTRFAVGADGTVLAADSTQATGLKWSTPLTNPMTTLGDIIYGGASGAATRLAGDTSNTRKFLRELSSGGVAAAPAWDTLLSTDLPSTANQINQLQNLGLSASVATNLLTVALKQSDGSTNATSSAPTVIGFRSATATSGGMNYRSVTAALSIGTVATGASLGTISGQNQYIYVYAIDNAGTVELALAGSRVFDEGSLQSTTAIGAGSTSNAVLYSTTARTNVPIRLIGRLKVNEATAGTYATSPAEVAAFTSQQKKQDRSEVFVVGSGTTFAGSTNTGCWTFNSSPSTNTGAAITFAQSATLGDTFTINEDGLYFGMVTGLLGNGRSVGLTRNASGTGLQNGPDDASNASTFLCFTSYTVTSPSGAFSTSYLGFLQAGDVIRVQGNAALSTQTRNAHVRLVKVCD